MSRDLVDKDVETGTIINGYWRDDPPTDTWHNAKAIREEFNEYFYNEGCVTWQCRCARIDI